MLHCQLTAYTHAIYVSCIQVELIRRDYVANNGWETFLSYEDPEQGMYILVVQLWR